MARKDPTAMALASAKKRIRTRVRLEMAIRADEILNAVLDEVEDEVQRRVASGTEAYELSSNEAWIGEVVERYYPRAKIVPLLEVLHPNKNLELEA